jgi:hypothetical protein
MSLLFAGGRFAGGSVVCAFVLVGCGARTLSDSFAPVDAGVEAAHDSAPPQNCVPGASPVTLATADQAAALSVDATDVYFTDYLGTVHSVPKGGGPNSSIAVGRIPAPDAIPNLALDDRFVFWGDPQTPGLLRSSKGGGRVDLLTQLADPGWVAVSNELICWTDSMMLSCSRKLGFFVDPVAIASGTVFADVALDPETVYWIDVDGIQALDLPGGTIQPGQPRQLTSEHARHMALDDASIFFTNSVAVTKIPKAGGTASTVAAAVAPGAIAVDADNVYWLDDAQGSVWRAPKSGAASPAVVTNSVRAKASIAVDDECLYFATAGALMKVSKR